MATKPCRAVKVTHEEKHSDKLEYIFWQYTIEPFKVNIRAHKSNFVLRNPFVQKTIVTDWQRWRRQQRRRCSLVYAIIILIKKIYRPTTAELRLEDPHSVSLIALYTFDAVYSQVRWHSQWHFRIDSANISCIFMTAEGRRPILLCADCATCWFYAMNVYWCFFSLLFDSLFPLFHFTSFHFIFLIRVLIALHFSRFHI